MIQLVTNRSRWAVRRRLRGLMAVLVGLVLIEIAVVAVRRVVHRPGLAGVGDLRGA